MNIFEHPELQQFLTQLNMRPEDFGSQEKIVLNKIINELERGGRSSLLDSLWLEDYEEKPVSVQQFIEDDKYIGYATVQGTGIWESWKQHIYSLHSPKNKVTRVLYSGAIGTGKSTIAVINLSYLLYKLLCLKNPTNYYGIMPGSKPNIALFNITLDKGFGVAFSKLNSICLSSPWFRSHGQEAGSDTRKIFIPDKDVNITVGSKADHFIGLDSLSCMMDEVSFKDNKELSLTKMQAYESLQTIYRRMESRFMDLGVIPGMLFLVSSTRTEDDFMSQYRETCEDDPHTVIVSRPFYEVVPQERYRGEKFLLALSTTTTQRFIIEPEARADVEAQGFTVYEIPVEHRSAFDDDLEGSIRDILGVPLKTAGKFLDSIKVDACVSDSYPSVLTTSEIALGFYDGTSILDYLDLSKVNTRLVRYPLFVHHDLATSGNGDTAGIYISAVAHNIENANLSSDEPSSWTFIPVLAANIRSSKKSEQIPLFKIREAVIKLRDFYGFNILAVSADGYQSADMLQQYKLAGFETYLISMDKAPSLGYQFFRSAIYNGRVFLPNIPDLIIDMKRLVENKLTQKVDHPVGGRKDLVDACAGSMYCAYKYNTDGNKHKIFSEGLYTLNDVILATNRAKESMPPIDINKEANQILREIGKGLFYSEDDGSPDFPVF